MRSGSTIRSPMPCPRGEAYEDREKTIDCPNDMAHLTGEPSASHHFLKNPRVLHSPSAASGLNVLPDTYPRIPSWRSLTMYGQTRHLS